MAARQHIDLTVTPAAREWLLAQNNEPEFGARPLRRIIARHLREPLADFLLSSSTNRQQQTAVTVDLKEGALHFDMGM
jgi:ATP-dependent Clp protease ATP-binding subunit ClpA